MSNYLESESLYIFREVAAEAINPDIFINKLKITPLESSELIINFLKKNKYF